MVENKYQTYSHACCQIALDYRAQLSQMYRAYCAHDGFSLDLHKALDKHRWCIKRKGQEQTSSGFPVSFFGHMQNFFISDFKKDLSQKGFCNEHLKNNGGEEKTERPQFSITFDQNHYNSVRAKTGQTNQLEFLFLLSHFRFAVLCRRRGARAQIFFLCGGFVFIIIVIIPLIITVLK